MTAVRAIARQWRLLVCIASAALVAAALVWMAGIARARPIIADRAAGVVVHAMPASTAPPAPPVDVAPGRVTLPTVEIAPGWLVEASQRTGIPARALRAYAAATATVNAEQPNCGLGWNTLAAIGGVESAHGAHGGAVLGPDGVATPTILGPALDGNGVAAIRDTDRGSWDGDTTWDHAVGPMQFIPSTWRTWGADGNGDGVADPNQIDDAALSAAHYLCASGSVDTPSGWRRAVLSYNHLDSYADRIAIDANRYADQTAGLT